MSRRGNNLQKIYRRCWMKCGNIIYDIQMQIVDDLGFSKYTVPLCITVIIF